MEYGCVNLKMEQGYLVLAEMILEKLRERRNNRQENRQARRNTAMKAVRPLASN